MAGGVSGQPEKTPGYATGFPQVTAEALYGKMGQHFTRYNVFGSVPDLPMHRFHSTVNVRDHEHNWEIGDSASVVRMDTYRMRTRLQWYGHVRWRDEQETTQQVLTMTVQRRNPRGRTKLMDTIWRDMCENWMEGGCHASNLCSCLEETYLFMTMLVL